eukprot:301956-Prymnesium_polylepis.1
MAAVPCAASASRQGEPEEQVLAPQQRVSRAWYGTSVASRHRGRRAAQRSQDTTEHLADRIWNDHHAERLNYLTLGYVHVGPGNLKQV